ncbi:hypothetical protein KO561_07315 [Radiobacillus kanasensis]|uniref:hypothetical protein n=1 Tax=Radiobacillus kanasensis TaxID=2844358 RepID=UPI001E2BD8D5|nr:hypothetical protein [Radiobacillus kanasensis]UFU00736.1 hypothetical protein KO561_07315 [Radiobacillus kanasensis]
MDAAFTFFPIVALFPFIISIGLAIFSIWFMINLLRNQKEKNQILTEILHEMKHNESNE